MSRPGNVHDPGGDSLATTSFVYPVRSLLSAIQRPNIVRGTSAGDAQVSSPTSTSHESLDLPGDVNEGKEPGMDGDNAESLAGAIYLGAALNVVLIM